MIEVLESPTFRKGFKKLPDPEKVLVEDEIDKIVADPELGEQKKGDIAYLRVHKFKINNRLTLLGYSWKEERLHLFCYICFARELLP